MALQVEDEEVVIEILQRNPESKEHEFIKIDFNGRQQFYVYDGEIEDNNLRGNFSQCFMIRQMLQKVYEFGQKNIPVEFKTTNID